MPSSIRKAPTARLDYYCNGSIFIGLSLRILMRRPFRSAKRASRSPLTQLTVPRSVADPRVGLQRCLCNARTEGLIAPGFSPVGHLLRLLRPYG